MKCGCNHKEHDMKKGYNAKMKSMAGMKAGGMKGSMKKSMKKTGRM